MSYYHYLMGFLQTDSPVGDIARDIRIDPNFPKHGRRQEMFEYLDNQNDIVSGIFLKSYDEYLVKKDADYAKQQRKNHGL